MRNEELTSLEDKADFFFGLKRINNVQSTLQKGITELNDLKANGLHLNQAFPLLIWSVIDLLSRYHSGQLENQRSMVRIKKYLREFLREHRQDTQTLILFRNAVSHSVSLFAFDASLKKEVRFRLTQEGPLVSQETPVRFVINTIEFHDRLLESINAYQNKLHASFVLQSRFQKVFRKLGYIQV